MDGVIVAWSARDSAISARPVLAAVPRRIMSNDDGGDWTIGRGSFGACFGRAALGRAGGAGATFAGAATDTCFTRVLGAGLAFGLAMAFRFGLAFRVGVGSVLAGRAATFAAFRVLGRPVVLDFAAFRTIFPTPAVLAPRVPDFDEVLALAPAAARPDTVRPVLDFLFDAVAFGDRPTPRFAMMEILWEP
ncbi:MAG: hypothetical protein ABMA15_02505 [Vicinamibacterales bacterium]